MLWTSSFFRGNKSSNPRSMARSMIMQWRIRENLWLKVETSFFPTNHGRIPRALGRRTLRCCMSSLPWSSRSMCLSSGQWQYNYTYITYIYFFKKMIYISATIQLQQTSCPPSHGGGDCPPSKNTFFPQAFHVWNPELLPKSWPQRADGGRHFDDEGIAEVVVS